MLTSNMCFLFSRLSTLRKKIAPRVLVIFGLLVVPCIAYMVEIAWTLDTIDGAFTSAKMYIVDLDGDSDLDIVGIAQTPDDVAWYENDGSENFTKNTIDSNAPGVRDVQVGDVDNDGDIDIVISQVDSTPDGVYWYDNDGSESFTKRTISTANNPIHIDLVDINGDDELDVLAALWSDGDIIYYENQGGTPSTFSANVIDATLSSPLDLEGADIDGDNDIDIIASHTSTSIPWYENDGSENFTKQSFATILSSSFVSDVDVVDVDGDSNLDMIIANSSNLYLFISDGNDNPSFTRSTIDSSASINHFSTADIDGDGDIDVVGADEAASGTVEWFDNNGSEVFTKYQIDSSVTYAWKEEVGDIDGDGDIDIVVGSNNGVELWLNGGDPNASASSSTRSWAARQTMRKLIKKMRSGIFVHEDTEAPTLAAVGIFDPAEQERLNAAAQGSGTTVDTVDEQSTEEESSDEDEDDSQGSAELDRVTRLHNRHQINAQLPAALVTTGDIDDEDELESEQEYESSQHERACERVYRRFSDNQKMIDRINERLKKRFGFACLSNTSAE